MKQLEKFHQKLMHNLMLTWLTLHIVFPSKIQMFQIEKH